MLDHSVRTTARYSTWALIVLALSLTACSDTPLEALGSPGTGLEGQPTEPIAREPETDQEAPPLEEESPQALSPPLSDFGLSVSALEPDRGPSEGELQVVMTGTGFRAGMEVLFGDLPVLDLFILNQGAALVTIPPHPPGIVDVIVRHLDIEEGEPFIAESAFLYESEIMITAIEPVEGSVKGGEALILTGSGFTIGTTFYIGGRAALEQTLVDPYTLTGRAPTGSAGLADVHVVTEQGVALLEEAYLYRAPPSIHALAPILGPAEGGTLVRLYGEGLSPDADVRFGNTSALVVGGAANAKALDVLAPPGTPGEVVNVSIETPVDAAIAPNAWAYIDPSTDPYLLICTHLFPSAGPGSGGEVVEIACGGLQYGASVAFGDALAEVLDVNPDEGRLRVLVPPGEPGSVEVTVSNPYATATLSTLYTYTPEPTLTVTSLSPNQGPTSGGSAVALAGSGFTDQTLVTFGTSPATETLFISESLIEVTSPPGNIGTVDVVVSEGGSEALMPEGFLYSDGELSVDLIIPNEVAVSGGTLLYVFGDGFAETSELRVDGEPCELVELIGPTMLLARSPRLDVGSHPASISTGADEVTRSNMLSAFDPRSGYSGTWGGSIQGTVNVTVYGVQGFGPIPGAFVYVTGADGQAVQGYTNDAGQVSLSETWIDGLVDVSATAQGWSAYTIARADAKNITILLKPTTPSAGAPEPIEYPPDAILSGRVLGLDKFVTPPPGPCSALPSTPPGGTCSPCETASDCASAGSACVDLLEQGRRCLPPCSVHSDCPDAYVCAGFDDNVTRCMPSPGEKIAKCGVSATSVFSQDIYPPETGWVGVGERFEFPSTRLGEIAIVCFGGYRASNGSFTPTALGVRRHVYATAGAVMENLDVTLTHPLDHVATFRLLEAPTWPSGTKAPVITLSLDLGPDGAIPLTRNAFPGEADMWRVARQIGDLSGNLYDASYTVYARVSADTQTSLPSAYTFEQKLTSLVSAQLPALDDEGWTLEPSNLARDFFAIWPSPEGRFTAVGSGGSLLFHNGNGWFAQASGTKETLRALDGDAWNNQWAAGDNGSLVHYDGLAWTAIEAPTDNFHGLIVEEGGELLLAGDVRLRRRDLAGQWSIEGPPSLQSIRGLARDEAGHVAAVGLGGRAYLRRPDLSWQTIMTPTAADLYAVVITAGGEVFMVGAGGTLLRADLGEDSATLVPLDTSLDLTSLHARGEDLYIGGDAALVLTRESGLWYAESIPGYGAKVNGLALDNDGQVTRVVGSANHVLGPFMGYPMLDVPTQDATTGALTLRWTSQSGPDAHYTRLNISTEKYGPTFWTLIVGRGVNEVVLPDLSALAGVSGLGSGTRSLDLQRIRNGIFDIDDYTTREFSIYQRESWSSDRVEFYAP